MKRRSLALLVSLCLSIISFAQLRIGVIGGPHSASVTEKNKIPSWENNLKPGYSSRPGLNLGVLVEMPLSSSGKWCFHPGIIYQSKGRKFFMRNDTAAAILTDTISSSYNMAVNYIEIPFNFTYKVSLSRKTRFLLSAGPYAGLFYNGKQKSETRIYSSNVFKDDEQNLESGKGQGKISTIDIGLNARAGFEIGNVLLTGFMSQGLSSFYKASYDGTFRHKVVGASVGFWLNRVAKPVNTPRDTDKDGIPDATDRCPDKASILASDGCPDTDGDGIADRDDECPAIAGTMGYRGCPAPDTDKDGIKDNEDKCPAIYGDLKYNGCPVPDSDGDGLNNESDACPDKAGTVEFNGCPVPDNDGDGLNDKEDKCPSEAGSKDNNGCPAIRQEILEKVNYAASNIFFDKNSDLISKPSYTALNQVTEVLRMNPSLRLTIEGHTDATGKESFNRALSQKRAEAVLIQISMKGIESNRLSAIGYGSSRPVKSNKTVSGQSKNRRVELKLYQ